MSGRFGRWLEGLGSFGSFVHGVDAGAVFAVRNIAFVLIAADGQEGNDDDGDG